MGYQQQEWNGNFLGNPGKKNAQRGNKRNPVDGGKNFKSGKIMDGLNSRDNNFPKKGRGPEWKMLRDSKPGKGSI